MRKYVVITVVPVVSAIAYVTAYVHVLAHTTASRANTLSRLGEVSVRLCNYRDANGSAPGEGVVWLGIPELMLWDPFSRQPFIQFTARLDGTDVRVIGQPKGFRSHLWPFGTMRRYAVLPDGAIRNVYQEAVPQG